MSMTKEELVQKLISQGVDADMAESLAKSATKGSTPKKTGNKKRYFGPARPKKYVGRLEVTDVCATCGTRTKRTLITEIDPNKPRNLEVPVSICSACIPRYRAMEKDELISLILLKDHPDIGFRMLSNKAQIRVAKLHTPEWVMAARLELEPAEDDRYIKPQYEEKPKLVDEVLLQTCQRIYNKAVNELGPKQVNDRILDLLADNTEVALEELRQIIPLIKKR